MLEEKSFLSGANRARKEASVIGSEWHLEIGMEKHTASVGLEKGLCKLTQTVAEYLITFLANSLIYQTLI